MDQAVSLSVYRALSLLQVEISFPIGWIECLTYVYVACMCYVYMSMFLSMFISCLCSTPTLIWTVYMVSN